MKNDLERILKALANRRRLMIIAHLKSQGSVSVADIAEAIHLSFKSTSRHLSILRSAEIIDKEQHDTHMFYRLTTPVHSIVRTVISLF